MAPDIEIDARDLLCPLPVLRLRKGLQRVASGQVVLLLATDPMAAIDIPHYCTEQGHLYLGSEDLDHGTAYRIRHG